MNRLTYRLAWGSLMGAALVGAAFSLGPLHAQKPGTVHVTRMFTGPDGFSHFEDLDVPTDPKAGDRTPVTNAATVQFARSAPGTFQDWHPEAQRQYVIALRGQLELEVGGGQKRVFGPGEILLAEDLTGQGHRSRTVGTVERVSIIVPLAK